MTRDTVRVRDTRFEHFAAELTRAVYPVVLGRGPKELWVTVELDLWRALAETVQARARRWPAAASADEVETWREGLIRDLTESAFDTAIRHGVEGSCSSLRLGLYEAIRRVAGNCLPVSASASWDPRQAVHPGVRTAERGIWVG
jgi:hypothetical protein